MSEGIQNIENEKENYPDYIEKVYTFDIPGNQKPERIDSFLARSILNATRAKVAKAIDAGNVTINGTVPKASRKIQPGDHIQCSVMKPPPIQLVPENIPLKIYYEDDEMMIVLKPEGMCTHPGLGNRYGTLVNAVLYHVGMREAIDVEDNEDTNEAETFASDGVRPGVVHRLDKDTSGILVVSKNPVSHAKLADQFANRTINRFYYTIVWGIFDEKQGSVIGDIGRSPRDRQKFAVVKRGGKHAHTDYEVIQEFDYCSLLKVKLHTGRTHQIRVHLSHIGHPVFGDKSYGGDKVCLGGHNVKWRRLAEKCIDIADRQMLHAKSIGLRHPVTNEYLEFESELPNDMQTIINHFLDFSK